MDRVTDKDDKDDEDEILYFKKIQSFGKNSDDKLNFNVEVNMNAVETLFCGNDVAIVFLDPYNYIADDDEKIRQLRINKALAGTFETLDTQFKTNDEEAIVLVTLYEQRMTKNALCVGLD